MGHTERIAALLVAAALSLNAQNRPVIEPRGVTNAFTLEPAPARVGQGSLVQITGLNLGPLEGATASGTPWPAELGGVRVSIGGRPAALYSVAPGKILAQVAQNANTGLAQVVVERDGQPSAPARVFVDPLRPSVKPGATVSGGALALSATGLGATGEDGAPAAEISVFVGGLPAAASVAASARPAEFDVRVEAPAAARPGDIVMLTAARQAANPVVYGSLRQPQVQFLPLPEGTPALQAIEDAGLNGNFVMANGARDDAGCYPAALFDFLAMKAAAVSGCLTAPNKNAVTPLVAPPNGSVIATLLGPPQGEPPNGVSSQLRIFSYGRDPLTVDLPGPANALDVAGADFTARLAGVPPRMVAIDSQTGEIGQAAAGTGTAAAVALANLRVDVEGLTQVLAAVSIAAGRAAVIAADDAQAPTRARFAVIGVAGAEVVFTKEFPEGWLPLLGAVPPAAARPNAPAAPAALPRGTVAYDSARRIIYALARSGDGSRHGFVAFAADQRTDPKLIAFPDGWFAPTCTANIRTFTLELSRRIALIGSGVAETAFSAACAGKGFLLVDLERQEASAAPLPAQSQINATGADELNDYIYAGNIDVSRRGQGADTLYVLDGITASAFTIALPGGIDSFTRLQPVAGMSLLIGAAMQSVAGDQGLIVFDLDQAIARLLAIPDGFNAVSELGVFPATRKMVARAQRPGASQLVVYDLVNGDVMPVPNPPGVASIGPVAAPREPQPGLPGLPGGVQLPAAAAGRVISANARANTVAAITYDAAGVQNGIVAVRVP
ncbi:MAG: hypothetical protein ACE15B_21590 [Bryobacteraceae bacterium]